MQLYHQPLCWKMSQPRICMALVVITGITADCFCLGWCSRQDGQVRISLLICSDMPGQNHLSLALSKHWRIFRRTRILWLFTRIPSMTAILLGCGHTSWHRRSSSWNSGSFFWVDQIVWISDSFAAVTSNVPIWLVSGPWLGTGGGTHLERQSDMCISTPFLYSIVTL